MYRYDYNHYGFGFDLSVLDSNERHRYDHFTHSQAQHCFAQARYLLKLQLAQAMDCRPHDISISIDSSGKPYMNEHTRHVSLAHSQHSIVFAIAGQNIGVDVEGIERPSKPWLHANRLLNPFIGDLIARESQTEQALTFARYWTCLEAYVKLYGSGIAQERKRFMPEFPKLSQEPKKNNQRRTKPSQLHRYNDAYFMSQSCGLELISTAFEQKNSNVVWQEWNGQCFERIYSGGAQD